MAWLFPFDKIEKNSTIVLYGAGSVGYEFYCQLTHTAYCKEVIWVDSQYKWYSHIGLPVKEPEIINSIDYDWIVVAVDRKEVYLSIKEYLVRENVLQNKILWVDNYYYDNKLSVSKYNSSIHIDRAFMVSPSSLIDENRLDIIVRYLYAQAILSTDCEEKYKELYYKLIQAVNKGVEPLNNGIYGFFSQYDSKKTIEEFDYAFRVLIESMQKEDFDKEHYIPLGKDSKPVNGAHRIAAALAIGIDAWVVKFDEIEGGKMCYSYNKDWLRNNGFNEDEVADIIQTYSVLKLGC